MQGILISSIRIWTMDFSLRINKTPHGWKQSWLPWHHALYNWVVFCGIRRLSRYVKAGQHEKAFELFKEMQQKGTTFDSFTFVPMLNACTSLGAREEVR
jgi:pentatricopeptide repeat protein